MARGFVLVASLAFVFGTACGGGGAGAPGGGGGGGGGGGAGTVARLFPPYDGVTDDATLVVRGTATSPDGIAGVTVAGVAATSNDGFASWTATVPLALGTNPLPVAATTGVGGVLSTGTVAVERVAKVPGVLSNLAYDAAAGDLYVVERGPARLLRVNASSGAVTTVADATVGSGPALANVRGLTLDVAGGHAYAGWTNAGAGTVLEVALATGDRTVVAGPGVGSGAALHAASDLDRDPDKGLLLVADPGGSALVWLDPATGVRTVLSSDAVGTGPTFGVGEPRRVVLDKANGRAFACGADALFAVDLGSGNRTLVSGNGVGVGPALIPVDLVLGTAPGTVIVARNAAALELLVVDVASGDRKPLDPPPGALRCLAPSQLALDAAGARVLAADLDGAAVRAASLVDGARADVWRPARGVGPELGTATAAVLEDEGHVLAIDRARPSTLLRVDLATGARTLLTSPNGPAFAVNPGGVALDGASGRALVLGDTPTGLGVVAVDLATGDRTMVSDPAAGFGPVLDSALGIDGDGVHAWITNGATATLVRVDLATGLRTTVSDAATGTGLPFTTLNGVLVDVPAGVAFVGAVDAASDYGVFAIDLATGDRTPVATTLVGTGGNVNAARSLSRAPASGALRFTDNATVAEADPITGNRVVVSGAGLGHGPRLSDDDVRVTRARADGTVVLLDAGTCALILVDPVTGERLLLAK